MLTKEANITIMVKDMKKSISFYQSIGFTLSRQWDNYYAQLVIPGATIGLHPANKDEPMTGSGNISIGLSTDNIDEAKTLLAGLSVTAIDRNEKGGQFLHFSDPDGTALYFINPKQ